MPVRDRSLPRGCICAAGPESTDVHGLGSRFGSSRRRLNTYLNNEALPEHRRPSGHVLCSRSRAREPWPVVAGSAQFADLAGCGPVFLAGQRGSAGGVAFPDLGGKGLDGGEGEVRAVAEDGVTRPGKSHEAGGAGREPTG